MKKKTDFLRSVEVALKGIMNLIRSERNFGIQLAVSAVVIAGGIILKISRLEWTIIIAFIGAVLAAEALNTALERLIDLLRPEWNEETGRIKDMAASAVLILSVSAVIAGLIIFLPKIF